ncbi:MAG: nucleotidyltransferase family protein [Deltaproteobacteria bacterium]|nr:nucleotidyltransferase family protein [Deltaproteobacteria bacterium]
MSDFPRQAIVLAAGLGTRLRPLTLRSPKPLLPVGGVPILLFNLFLLKESGIRRIVVNLHHLPEKIRRCFRDGKSLGLRLSYSFEPKILGTAGGIAQALDVLEDRGTFVLNGDIIFDLDLKKMATAHRRSGAKATLACIPKNRAEVQSFVEFDAAGRIRRIAGGPEATTRLPRLKQAIFSGAHLLEPELFRGYPRHEFGCVVRQVYQPAIARGERLQAYEHRGSWWDLGSLAELTKVDRALWREESPAPILRLWREARRWAERGGIPLG